MPDALPPLLKRREMPFTSRVQQETVMLSLETDRYYGLGRVGSRIWELLASPTDLDSLCERLQAEYRVDGATCRRDVEAFLRRLREEGLLE